MIRINQALWGLILVLISLPGLCQNQEAAPEVEYASVPTQRETGSGTSPSTTSARPAKASGKTRRAQAPLPTPTPVALPAPGEAALPAAPEVELPSWRVTAATLLTPFGINSMLAKVGMSGAPADILGLILLAILALVLLWLLFKVVSAVRYRIADQLREKQLAKPEPKREPLMKNSRPRDSSNSRLNPNSRGGPHTRPSPRPETRGGQPSANSRLGPETRGNYDSRMGPETRGNYDSRMGPETRGHQDSRLRLDSRMGGDSRIGGDTRFDNSRMGPETRAMNPVLPKKDVPNAPENFDQPRFLRKARVYFLRLQLAWDKSDLNSIRQFATTPIFNELRKQILERGDSTNNTDVLSIQTELLGIEISGNNYVASVKFSGTIKESQSPSEEAFEEIWSLSLPVDKKGDWVLSGIAQY